MNRKLVKGCPSTMGDDVQLNTTTLIRHAARTHGDQQIVFRTPEGGWDRYTYGGCYRREGRAGNEPRRPAADPRRPRRGPRRGQPRELRVPVPVPRPPPRAHAPTTLVRAPPPPLLV